MPARHAPAPQASRTPSSHPVPSNQPARCQAARKSCRRFAASRRTRTRGALTAAAPRSGSPTTRRTAPSRPAAPRPGRALRQGGGGARLGLQHPGELQRQRRRKAPGMDGCTCCGPQVQPRPRAHSAAATRLPCPKASSLLPLTHAGHRRLRLGVVSRHRGLVRRAALRRSGRERISRVQGMRISEQCACSPQPPAPQAVAQQASKPRPRTAASSCTRSASAAP